MCTVCAVITRHTVCTVDAIRIISAGNGNADTPPAVTAYDGLFVLHCGCLKSLHIFLLYGKVCYKAQNAHRVYMLLAVYTFPI